MNTILRHRLVESIRLANEEESPVYMGVSLFLDNYLFAVHDVYPLSIGVGYLLAI